MPTVDHFGIVAPATVSGGVGFAITITAMDSTQGNATDTGYVGVVTFSSSDPAAAVPPKHTLTNGVGVFSYTLNTQGNQTVTGIDKLFHYTGVSSLIGVLTPGVNHIQVQIATNVVQGVPFFFTVSAMDQTDTVRTDYKGTVHFGSTDSLASLPADTTLTSGTGKFVAVMNTVGTRRLTIVDTVNNSLSFVAVLSIIQSPPVPPTLPPSNIWTEVHYPYPASPIAVGVAEMPAGESGPYAYDFSNDPVFKVTGELILAVVSVTATPITPSDGSAPDLLISSPPLLNAAFNAVFVTLSGEQAGVEYLVEFTVQTTNGYIRIGRGILDIV